MEEIKLTEPTIEYANEVWAMRRELRDAGDRDAFAGCEGLEEYDTYAGWLERLRLFSDPATVPEGFVDASAYLAVRQEDGRVVGIIDLRHHINHPILGTWGGHIGYIVRPTERGKGYAPKMLRLCLDKARQRGIERVLGTCHPENTASERTILRCGGAYENTVDTDGGPVKRYWIDAKIP